MNLIFKEAKNKPTVIIIILILIYTITLVNLDFKGFRDNIISGDGRGYYAYLPAIFIHKTLDFTKIYEIEKEKYSLSYQGHYFIDHDDIKINKYYSGTALLLLPFFLLAYFLSFLFGYSLDGYSLIFQYAVFIGGIFYGLLGLFFSKKLLSIYTIPKNIISIILILILFGTNLFYYTFVNPSFSHVYSFSMIAVFLYFTKKTFINYEIKNIFWASVALGLTILIRPTNFIILFIIPFLASDFKLLKQTIKRFFKFKKELFISFLSVFLIICIQFFINIIQTGKPLIWSYSGEGFKFFEPEITNMLLSYRKGLFIYTPLIFISLFGLIPLFRQSKYRFATLTIFLIILVYFIPSWWNWFYGDSFGMRAFIDFYPVFILLLGILITSIKFKITKIFLCAICFVLLLLNLIQTYQYIHKIIHPDAMNKEKYWFVFLKTGYEYKNIFGGTDEESYKKIKEIPLTGYFNDFEEEKDNWTLNSINNIGDTAFSGKKVANFDILTEYNAGLKINSDSSLINAKNVFIKVNLKKYDLEKDASLKARLVVEIKFKNGRSYFYKTFRLSDLPQENYKEWEDFEISFQLPKILTPDDIITLFIWNTDKKMFYVDDMKVGFFELQE